jgi:hypothetical protein
MMYFNSDPENNDYGGGHVSSNFFTYDPDNDAFADGCDMDYCPHYDSETWDGLQMTEMSRATAELDILDIPIYNVETEYQEEGETNAYVSSTDIATGYLSSYVYYLDGTEYSIEIGESF